MKGVVVVVLACSVAQARPLPQSSAAQLRAAFRPAGRPRLVHLWATWCHACVAELPALSARLTELRGAVDPVFVALDDDTHAEEAAATLDKLGAPGIKLRAGPDAGEALLELDAHWDGSIPATYWRESEMKTTKIAIALAFLAGVAQAKAPAAGGTAVNVKGHYYETCSCAVSCPCGTNKFLPTESHCDLLSLFHLDKATVGSTKLDGLNVAIVGKTPKNLKVTEAFEKGAMDHWAVYFDDKATDDQKKAIPMLMEALFGKMEIKGAKAPAFVPIKLTIEGDKAMVDVAAGKMTADIENIKIGEAKMGDKMTPKYITLDGAVPFPWMGKVTQGRSISFKYTDGALKWDYKDKNAFFGEFTHKATLAAAAN